MSGPVRQDDLVEGVPPGAALERWSARSSEVGGLTVRRALPRRARRTVGAWCFVDHFGPVEVTEATAMRVGPHPHIGLHTVTWLLDGEVRHTDSLGSDQVIRPGQLNLMTAGGGIAHAEEATPASIGGTAHGVQLWVAQPESTRHGPAAFAHHADLPEVDLGGAEGTVLVGTVGSDTSPARVDTPLLGVDLRLSGPTEVPLEPAHEHAVLVLTGRAEVEGSPVAADEVVHLPTGRGSVALRPEGEGARALLLGGAPFPDDVLMWWNFVARTPDEVVEARAAWQGASDRFGAVESGLDRIPAPETPWG